MKKSRGFPRRFLAPGQSCEETRARCRETNTFSNVPERGSGARFWSGSGARSRSSAGAGLDAGFDAEFDAGFDAVPERFWRGAVRERVSGAGSEVPSEVRSG